MSVTLLLCVFILCCSGALGRWIFALATERGYVAAIALLCAAASGFSFAIFERIFINAASMILLLFALLLCKKERSVYPTVLLSFLLGILAWLLQRQFPTFAEQGLIVATPAIAASLLLPISARKKLLLSALSPIFFGLVVTLEDWYLFDAANVSLGSALQLDAQMCGIAINAVASGLPVFGAKKVFDMQKEY